MANVMENYKKHHPDLYLIEQYKMLLKHVFADEIEVISSEWTKDSIYTIVFKNKKNEIFQLDVYEDGRTEITPQTGVTFECKSVKHFMWFLGKWGIVPYLSITLKKRA